MIDLTEIKKLPREEKWKIIEEIEESMESEDMPEEDIDPEILKEMKQRLDDLRSGKDLGYTWEEAKAILLKEINNKKSVDA